MKWEHKNAESWRLRFYWIGPRASSFSSVVHIFSAAAKTARRRFHNRTKLQKQAFSCLLVFRSWIPMNRDASDFLSTIEPQISLSFSFDSFWASSSTSRLNTRTHARTHWHSIHLSHTHARTAKLPWSFLQALSLSTHTNTYSGHLLFPPSLFLFLHTYLLSHILFLSLAHTHTQTHTQSWPSKHSNVFPFFTTFT